MNRRLVVPVLVLSAAVGLAGCSGEGEPPQGGTLTGGVTDEETTAELEDGDEEEAEREDEEEAVERDDEETAEEESPCAAAADELEVEYGDPVAVSDMYAEDDERTWRHGVPVTVRNTSDVDCYFEITAFIDDGDDSDSDLAERKLALRAGQVAYVEDFPILENHVAFDKDDAEDGVPTYPWSVEINRVEGFDLHPDYYEYEVTKLEDRYRDGAEIRMGAWPKHSGYALEVALEVSAMDPDDMYEDPEPELLGGVMTTLLVNGLDADGNVIATWVAEQSERPSLEYEMPAVGGGQTSQGIAGRGTLFFVSDAMLESVVEYDIVSLEPADLLGY